MCKGRHAVIWNPPPEWVHCMYVSEWVPQVTIYAIKFIIPCQTSLLAQGLHWAAGTKTASRDSLTSYASRSALGSDLQSTKIP